MAFGNPFKKYLYISLSLFSSFKPEAFKNTQVSDFFDFMFTGLPHKLLEPQQFLNAVGDLKKRFVDPKNSEFILHTEHFQKDIPADGLAPYASRIWVCRNFIEFSVEKKCFHVLTNSHLKNVSMVTQF